MGQEVTVSGAGELALEGGQHRASNASEACSRALWTRLTGAEDADGACRTICHVPALLEEVRTVAATLAEFARPAEAVELVEHLLAIAPVYGIAERPPEEWATLWRAYIEALAPLPLEAIKVALTQWNREASYFPKPGEIYTRAIEHATRLRTVAYRARKAAEFRPRPAPKSAEQRAAERQELIDQGILTPDGKVNLQLKGFDPGSRMVRTPQQVAEGLRAQAEQHPPINPDDVPETV